MPFTTGPQLRYVGQGQYLTCGPTLYVGRHEVFNIPADTKTDLASIPRIFWVLLAPTGSYENAAVLHDWFCQRLALHDCVVSARDADSIFRRVMREAGVGLLTRWAMWTGVRWGAVANPCRRPGWLRDAPAVIAITAVLLAVLLAALLGLHALVNTALEAL